MNSGLACQPLSLRTYWFVVHKPLVTLSTLESKWTPLQHSIHVNFVTSVALTPPQLERLSPVIFHRHALSQTAVVQLTHPRSWRHSDISPCPSELSGDRLPCRRKHVPPRAAARLSPLTPACRCLFQSSTSAWRRSFCTVSRAPGAPRWVSHVPRTISWLSADCGMRRGACLGRRDKKRPARNGGRCLNRLGKLSLVCSSEVRHFRLEACVCVLVYMHVGTALCLYVLVDLYAACQVNWPVALFHPYGMV